MFTLTACSNVLLKVLKCESMLLTLAANSFRVVLERGNMVLVLPYISHDMEVSRICEMLSSVD
jgi:hypothetical protein